MPGLEQNQGTNFKLKSAIERSEILNNGGTQHLKTLFNESFSLVASNQYYTTFCQIAEGIR